MRRDIKKIIRMNQEEDRRLKAVAEQLKRNESDTVRFLIAEKYEELKETVPG